MTANVERVEQILYVMEKINYWLRYGGNTAEHTTCLGTTGPQVTLEFKCPQTEMPHRDDRKNDVTMKCAGLCQGYQRGLIINYDAHARRFRKAQVISSSADLRWTLIGPRQEGLRCKVCEKVYHDKFINGRRDF